VLKVVDSEGGIHTVAIPTCDQLHASQFHVVDEPEFENAPPQAMLYQAMFKGITEQHGHGFSRKEFQARVLVDSGATRDFVSQRYVDRHGLKTFAADKPMNVALADGKRMIASRKMAMTLDFGEYKYARNVYVLPLGVGADVILGMPWLYSLGRFECDMRMNELSFTSKVGHGTRRVVLGGQPNAPRLENSKVLPFGKAITEMRAAIRLLKTEEGPTVEQVKAATKAMRQAGEEVYGYDHKDDPRSHINPAWLVNHPGAPLCYLCYLLPSRDVEDIKGEAGLDSSKPAKKPHIWEGEGLEQKPKPQIPQSTAKAAQTCTTWDLPKFYLPFLGPSRPTQRSS
jgi:hypothetical protein